MNAFRFFLRASVNRTSIYLRACSEVVVKEKGDSVSIPSVNLLKGHCRPAALGIVTATRVS